MRYGIILLVLIAMIGIALPATHSPTPTYAQDNTITIGTMDVPANLDPALADTFMSWEILSHIYTGLTRQVAGTNTYELAAAAEHRVSEDQLTHTFTLKSDLSFTDGSPITAQTFERSINRVLRLDRGGATVMKTMVESVNAVDDLTLEFTLYEPIPYFDAVVALPPFFAVHADDFPVNAVNRDTPTLIGNGLYILDSWQPADFVRLNANPDYQLGEVARNDQILLKAFTDTEQLRLAISNRAVDVVWRDMFLPDAIRTGDESEDIVLHFQPSLRMWYFYISSNPDFDDSSNPAVRQSLLSVLDRERVTGNYFNGYLAPAYGLVPEMLGDAHTSVWDVPRDPDLAVTLLTEANYRQSQRNNVTLGIATSQPAYGDFHANGIRSLNVDFVPIRPYMNINPFTNIDGPVFIDALQNGDYQMAGFAWTPVTAHPDAYLRP